MSVRLCLLSDTHIHPGRGLPPCVISAVIEHDVVLHAGDICSVEALYELRALRKTMAVYGNCDAWDLRHELSRSLLYAVEGIVVGLVHGDGSRGSALDRAVNCFPVDSGVSVIVYGHSHIPCISRRKDVTLINPGSITQPRTQPRPSYASLLVSDGRFKAELRYL